MRTQPTVEVVSFIKASSPTPTVMMTVKASQVSAHSSGKIESRNFRVPQPMIFCAL